MFTVCHLLGSRNQLHPTGHHQPALTLSHRTPLQERRLLQERRPCGSPYAMAITVMLSLVPYCLLLANVSLSPLFPVARIQPACIPAWPKLFAMPTPRSPPFSAAIHSYGVRPFGHSSPIKTLHSWLRGGRPLSCHTATAAAVRVPPPEPVRHSLRKGTPLPAGWCGA